MSDMIRKIVIFCAFVAFVGSACMACQQAVQTAVISPVAATNRDPAVAPMLIEWMESDGEELASVCTAWKIGENLLASAGHCCVHDNAIYTLSGRHAPLEPKATRLTHTYGPGKPDACILVGRIDGATIELAPTEPAWGEQVWTMGYPSVFSGKQTPLMSDGRWTMDDDSDGVASTVVIGGASGSPVFNLQGQAVGILWGGDLKGSHSVTLITPLKHVRIILENARAMMQKRH